MVMGRLITHVPGAVPLILWTVLLSMLVVPLGYMVRAPESGPTVKAAKVAVAIETRIASEGFDKQHRRVPFTVYILSEQFSWKLESTTDFESPENLVSPELRMAINKSRDVLCIGTASFEGAVRTEEARAAQRARILAQWIGGAILDSRKTRLFTVNAGQYQGPGDLLSTYQRRAIIIATSEHQDNVDLGDALRSGLEGKQKEYPIIASLLHHYSRSAALFLFAPVQRDALHR